MTISAGSLATSTTFTAVAAAGTYASVVRTGVITDLLE
jgi:hypothetical protein